MKEVEANGKMVVAVLRTSHVSLVTRGEGTVAPPAQTTIAGAFRQRRVMLRQDMPQE